jgi:hypothetical protein
MSAQDETRWRQALASRGRDWVAHELQLRAGQPNEYLWDVVYEAPHPTREFCQRWCAEQENKIVGLSPGITVAMLMLVVVTIAGGIFAARDFERARPVQTAGDMR